MRSLIRALIRAGITDVDAALVEAGARHAKIDRERLREILALVTQVLGNDPEARDKAQAELDAIGTEGAQPVAEAAGMSLTDLMEKLRAAVRVASPSPMTAPGPAVPSLYVDEIFDDYLVVVDEATDRRWKRTYSVAEDGTVTLGDPVEVREETTYVPIAEANPHGYNQYTKGGGRGPAGSKTWRSVDHGYPEGTKVTLTQR